MRCRGLFFSDLLFYSITSPKFTMRNLSPATLVFWLYQKFLAFFFLVQINPNIGDLRMYNQPKFIWVKPRAFSADFDRDTKTNPCGLPSQGCKVRDHVVSVDRNDPRVNKVYDDLLEHRDMVCISGYRTLSDEAQ